MAKKRTKKRRKNSKAGEYIVFCGFMLMGMVVFCLFTIVPGKLYLRAKNWPEVPCRILASEAKELASSSQRGGASAYVPHIEYAYVHNGNEFTSDRYGIFDSRTTKGSAQRIANGFPVSTEATCYVDPTKPARAMLNRNFSWTIVYGLAGICASLIGAVGLYNTVTGKWNTPRPRRKKSGKKGDLPPSSQAKDKNDNAQETDPQQIPKT